MVSELEQESEQPRLIYLYTWEEYFDVLDNNQSLCRNCDTVVYICGCHTELMVEMDSLETVERNGRVWVVAPDEDADGYCDCCECDPCDCDWGS